MKIFKNEEGQLTIFLGLCMLIIITLLAFVINVGLFVKSKINLQNAVDAAAWSGAAVQARQLTRISYINWELRNNFKEWMYKYYILGQKGIPSTHNGVARSGNMNFRARPFDTTGNAYDRFNIPSICLHFGSERNICEIASVPGLPRFESVGLAGVSEHSETYLDTIVATKAADCASRSDINFAAAMSWTYGTADRIFPNAKALVSDRPGAWIKSIELGMRMRNLEMLVNYPPEENPLCLSGTGCRQITELEPFAGGGFPLTERPIKAFWSAYRNLSGGPNKDNSPLAQNFKLTELAPENSFAPSALSEFLIPDRGFPGSGGVSVKSKSYLDLQVMPVNYAIMYKTLLAVSENQVVGDSSISEGACQGSKTAVPVPGYITGFVKNPKVLTYYAVKGESKFRGLFFPFAGDGIDIKAYAAAKPFGGRIGPRLFDIQENEVHTRSSGRSTLAYLTSLSIDASFGTDFRPGYPIPFERSFWLTTGTIIGGVPGDGAPDNFIIPNMIYDITDNMEGQIAGDAYQRASVAFSPANSMQPPSENGGLYDSSQFTAFVANDLAAANATVTEDIIARSIFNVRKPTRYDAINYLIPNVEQEYSSSGANPLNLENIPLAKLAPAQPGHYGVPHYELYAPLLNPNALFQTQDAASLIVKEYLDSNQGAITTFLNSLNTVSESMRAVGTRGGNSYSRAADTLYNAAQVNSLPVGNIGDPQCENLSLATKFKLFFKTAGAASSCGVKSLGQSIQEYFGSQGGSFNTFHTASFAGAADDKSDHTFMSAYSPGPRQGATDEGESLHPYIADRTVTSRRNFYSTKFISINSVISGGNYQVGVFKEGNAISSEGEDTPQNFLSRGEISDFKNAKH